MSENHCRKTAFRVIAQKHGADLAGTAARVGENEYVIYLENGGEPFDLPSRLTSGSRSRNHQRLLSLKFEV